MVLDNCEHVIDAAATLAEKVVRLCPRTTILATSREAFRIEGEYVYRVPPLLFETIRAYALEKLGSSGEIVIASRRHAEYYRDLLVRRTHQSDQRLSGGDLELLGEEIENLRAALDWSFSPAGDATTGVLLTAELTPLWVHMSLMDECRDCVERALAAGADARTEMRLNAALGTALTYTTGPAEQTAATWTRTLELAEELGDTEYQLQALRGLWSYRMNNGEYHAALVLATRFCDLAQHHADGETTRAGDRMAALILHYLGEQAEARARIEWSLGSPVTASQLLPATRFVLDQGVAANALLARILWLQGLPDRAACAAENAIRQADDHVLSHCHALAQAACPLALWTGDLRAAARHTTMLIDLATHNALEGWIARGKCFQGALLIHRGSLADGVAQLRTALQELRAAGSSAEYPFFLATLAQGLMSAGQIRQAEAAIDEAIDRSEATGERWCAAELLRIKAEILLLSDASNTTPAEQSFRQSLDVARRQGALSWELRAARGLARLPVTQSRQGVATAILALIYGRFTEGFATADLQAAPGHPRYAQVITASDYAR